MSGPGSVSRRSFVQVVSVAGAGLTLGISLEGCGSDPAAPASDAAFAPDAWIRVNADSRVMVVVDRSEMGQGISTALPQLVAEELGVSLDAVDFRFAPAHPAYRHPDFGMQMTGGSTSVPGAWRTLREAGAKARWMLQQAAAERWSVDAGSVQMAGGQARHPDGNTALTYGELAEAAALIPVPETVPLKDPSEFTLIGTSPPRLDVPDKTTGRATFGIDAGPENARVAVVARCPEFGGTLRSFDASAALAVPGVSDVVEIASGVAVVADGYWNAQKGRQALTVEWAAGPGAALDDATIRTRFMEAVAEGGKVAAEAGDAETALAEASDVQRATYALPYLAHATMEPMNCTAWVEGDRCTVWAPTQWQEAPSMMGGGSKGAAAKAGGVSADRVDVHTTYLGGGFGRRAQLDFVSEAAELASKVDGPVRVVWSREDDMQHDFYRPASYHELEATLGSDGMPAAWRHHMALQSIMDQFIPGWIPGFLRSWMGLTPGGVDPTSTEGASNQPYGIPNLDVRLASVELPIPVGFWRSVGNSHNGFVVESFIDELAHAAAQDPYQYRRRLLGDAPRHLGVLDRVAEMSDWGSEAPGGRARGIAVVESFGSYVAQVAEVSVDENNRPRVHKVWCAVDCGVVVNPRIVRAQMESGIVFGLTAALYGKISIDKGRVVQSNFHDYQMLRINEAPEMEVALVESTEDPGGVGEPGTPPIAPAVGNALYALTGTRVRELPIAL